MNPYIWIKDDVLPAEACESIVAKFEADSRKGAGVTSGGVLPEIKRSTDLFISGATGWEQEDAVFFAALAKHHPEYQKHADSHLGDVRGVQIFNSSDVKDSGYQVQRTSPGEEYDWHHDAHAIGDYLRVLTFIWYLNDVAEGGETEFYDGTLIKPVRGRMVMFPATWTFMHRGRTPASDKYIATGWMSYNTAKGNR